MVLPLQFELRIFLQAQAQPHKQQRQSMWNVEPHEMLLLKSLKMTSNDSSKESLPDLSFFYDR